MVVAGTLLASCGADPSARIATALPAFHNDTAALLRAWNGGDAAAFVACADAKRSLPDPAALQSKVALLRNRLGAVVQHGVGWLDAMTGDARIYVIGHHVWGTDRGIARLDVAYDRDFAIVGLDLGGRVHERQ